jgi:hypothetical protein
MQWIINQSLIFQYLFTLEVAVGTSVQFEIALVVFAVGSFLGLTRFFLANQKILGRIPRPAKKIHSAA